MSPKKRGAVSLILLTPGLLLLSGCSNSNCDSNHSTPQTSDDCGPGSNSRASRGFFGGGGGYFRGGGGGGSSVESGSMRGGFGSSGRGFGGGFSGGGE